jgi:catechol 2,3-dioxygenase-like lactoylglutathione lyase family enzyme
MIGYTTVGSNDLEKSVAFYDDLLALMGAKRFMEADTFVAWAVSPEQPAFSVCKPFEANCSKQGVLVSQAGVPQRAP